MLLGNIGESTPKKLSMICGFWKCRIISAPGRKLFIDENLVPLNVDYIGFQETKKEEFTNSFLK
jgi:hypothetical protein